MLRWTVAATEERSLPYRFSLVTRVGLKGQSPPPKNTFSRSSCNQRPELLCNRPLARIRAEQTNLHHGIPTFVAGAHERALCQIIADQAQWQPRDTTTVLRHCFQGCTKMRGKYRLKPGIAALISANFSQDSSEPGYRAVNQVGQHRARRSR